MREAPLDPVLKYFWQQAVFDALIEYHPDRLRDKVAEAERAITGRLLQKPTDPHEVLALRDAWLCLQTLFRTSKVVSTDKKQIG
jgi:hypothetical protein